MRPIPWTLVGVVGVFACGGSGHPAASHVEASAGDGGSARDELDISRLGPPCGVDLPCADGASCVAYSAHRLGPRCVAGNPCALLTCEGGRICVNLQSLPAQLVCDHP